MTLIDEIKDRKIIAIVRGIGNDCIVETCRALYDGGIRLIEITFDQSSENGIENTCAAIRLVAKTLPQVAVGAGTVVSVEQVQRAVEAGAGYIISPNTDRAVIEMTKALGAVSIPGAMTPTEVIDAFGWGADFVKLFPAGTLGIEYLKALRAPLKHIPMLAVGGVDHVNIRQFIDAGMAGVGIGATLADPALARSGDYAALRERAEKIVAGLGQL